MVLVSEDDAGLSSFSFEESSSEESLSEDEESLELESDGGNGVFTAALRDFLSAFFAGLFSESVDEEESEDESLSEESLSEESESDEEELEDSEDDSLDLDSVDNLAFLFLGASFSDSESESELKSESDSEELDSAFRFTPVDLEAGAASSSSSSSSSSSASLSELEEEDEDEDEEEDEDDEGDDSRDAFLAFGASSISTSESLESSELLSLSLEEELGLADFFTFDWLSQFLNSSSNDGTFFESAVIDLSACSLANALFVFSKPCSDKKPAIDAINCAGGDDALELLLALVWWCKQLSATSTAIGVLIGCYLLVVLRFFSRGSHLSSHGECPCPGVSFLFSSRERRDLEDTKKKKKQEGASEGGLHFSVCDWTITGWLHVGLLNPITA